MNKSRVPQQIQPDGNAHPGHQAQGQDEIHDIDRTGEPHKPIQKQDHQDQAHRGHRHRLDHVHEINQASVAPHAAVEIEPVEEENFHQNDERQRHLQSGQEWLGDAPLEAQQVGAHVGAHYQDDVQRKDKPEITIFNKILHIAKIGKLETAPYFLFTVFYVGRTFRCAKLILHTGLADLIT